MKDEKTSDRDTETRVIVFGGSAGWSALEILTLVLVIVLLLLIICSCTCIIILCTRCTRCCCLSIREGIDRAVAGVQRIVSLGFIGLLQVLGRSSASLLVWIVVRIAGLGLSMILSVSGYIRRAVGLGARRKARQSPPNSDIEEDVESVEDEIGESMELADIHTAADQTSLNSYHSVEENMSFIDRRYNRLRKEDLQREE